MIKVNEARDIILSNVVPSKRTETIEIASCLNRICAVDIKSKENIPPFDNSAMDGFALRAQDSHLASKDNPRILEIIEDVPAGYVPAKKIKPNQAIRIMTGAPVPKGADAVIMLEDTVLVDSPPRLRRDKQSTPPTTGQAVRRKKYGLWTMDYGLIRIFKEVKPGENVRYAGEDVKKNEAVIKRGSILKAGHIGILASLGFSKIKAHIKPRVGILSTGDELVGIKNRLAPGKIRNSNSYSLSAQVLRTQAIPVLLGIARDRKNELKDKIKKGLSVCDILLVSGGISVGDYDLVKEILAGVGMEMKFWQVAMRPGKPLAFGVVRSRGKMVFVFGLPGNPVSSMLTFEQFVRPAILKLAGAEKLFRFHLPAILNDHFQKKAGLRYFLRVVLENRNGGLYASLTGPQGSGILKSFVLANGIMELPEEVTEVKPGETVQVTYC